jgi:hypothetical protein
MKREFKGYEEKEKEDVQHIVVLRLVASCRWNCGLGKLSTILKKKILRRQLYMQLPRMFISTNPAVQCTLSFTNFHHNGHQLHPREPHRLRSQHTTPHI